MTVLSPDDPLAIRSESVALNERNKLLKSQNAEVSSALVREMQLHEDTRKPFVFSIVICGMMTMLAIGMSIRTYRFQRFIRAQLLLESYGRPVIRSILLGCLLLFLTTLVSGQEASEQFDAAVMTLFFDVGRVSLSEDED